MNVERKPAEVVKPPDTIDITGLTLREAGALRYLVAHGLSWYRQDPDIKDFFRGLTNALALKRAEPVTLRMPTDEDEDDEF